MSNCQIKEHTQREQNFLQNDIWADRIGLAHLNSKPFATSTEIAGNTDETGTTNLLYLMGFFMILNKYNEIRRR